MLLKIFNLSILFTLIFLIIACESLTEPASISQYRILYTSFYQNYENVFSVKEDGSDIIQHTEMTDADSWHPIWSPDASKIVFYNGLGYDIYRVDFDGTNLVNLTQNQFIDNPFSISAVTNLIAFTSDRSSDGSTLDIFTMDLNGANLKRLTSEENSTINPTWSPDGQNILYTKSGVNGQLFTMDAEGENKTPITDIGINPFNFSWSHDGEHVVYGFEGRIFVVRSDGTEPSLISDTTKIARYPDWSPAGDRIAFTYVNFDQKDQVSINEIWIVARDGGFQQKIAEGIEWHSPVFSPDGDKIIFNEYNDHIYIMKSNGENLRRLTQDDGGMIHRYYSWSPNKFE